MNYADIKQYDVANGPGVRVSLFVSGCTHHCRGCFNPETWDFAYGKPFTEDTIEELIRDLEPSYIKGLTLLGGDPMERCNQIALLPLLRRVKACYPEKTIWCYTGYDFEKDICGRMMDQWEATREFLSYLDVLVDGEFVMEKKNLGLAFRGSSNQRILFVQESLREKRVCLWQSETDRVPQTKTKEEQYFHLDQITLRVPARAKKKQH